MSALAWIADALVVIGLGVMTLGVVGVLRMPDVYAKLHVQSKTVALGVVALLAAAAITVGPAATGRGLLIALFVLLTSPVSAHVTARAAWRREQRAQAGEGDASPRDASP